MPDMRHIFVGSFACIVIIFLWLINRELRKKYGETPEGSLSDKIVGTLALPRSNDSFSQEEDPAPTLRPSVPVNDHAMMPTAPWLTRAKLLAMGPTERLQSAHNLLERPGGIKYRKNQHGPKGEYLWACQSYSQEHSNTYCIALSQKGATWITLKIPRSS